MCLSLHILIVLIQIYNEPSVNLIRSTVIDEPVIQILLAAFGLTLSDYWPALATISADVLGTFLVGTVLPGSTALVQALFCKIMTSKDKCTSGRIFFLYFYV